MIWLSSWCARAQQQWIYIWMCAAIGRDKSSNQKPCSNIKWNVVSEKRYLFRAVLFSVQFSFCSVRSGCCWCLLSLAHFPFSIVLLLFRLIIYTALHAICGWYCPFRCILLLFIRTNWTAEELSRLKSWMEQRMRVNRMRSVEVGRLETCVVFWRILTVISNTSHFDGFSRLI